MLYLHNNEVVERPDSVSLLIPTEGTDPEWEALNSSDEFYAVTVENPSEQELEQANYHALPDQPEYDLIWQKCVLVRSEWTIIPSDAAKLRDKMWQTIRHIRDGHLAYTDDLIREYSDNDEQIPQELKDDRQSLRDFPQVHQTGEIEDWVSALPAIKSFSIYGTTSSENYNAG